MTITIALAKLKDIFEKHGVTDIDSGHGKHINWRTAETFFTEGNLLGQGTINLSPCWHPVGHKVSNLFV